MKKLVFVLSMMLFGTVYAQESNVMRINSEAKTELNIPANSNGQNVTEPEFPTFVIGSGQFTIPTGQVEMEDGTILTASQVERLQSVIDNELYDFLGLFVEVVPNLYYHEVALNPSRSQELSFPTVLTIPQEAVFRHRPNTWSGDNDTLKSAFYVKDEAGVKIGSNLYDSGYVNWPDSHNYRSVNVVIPAGTSSVVFYAACYRYSGSTCSAMLSNADVTLNGDLPAVGETIIVK